MGVERDIEDFLEIKRLMKSSEWIKFCKHVFIKQVLPKLLKPIVEFIIEFKSRFIIDVSLVLL
jgi:hypothetical protein